MRERLLNEVLLHVAAHLRTALGGMHIAVSRLAPPERRDADAALDRDAALLNRNYYALLRLSNNLSNAPMLLDDAPLTRENTDIVTWLDGLCRQASPLFALRKVALTFQCSAAHHGAAINRVCLEQAVWNLLSNALKFTAEGGAVTVSLRFERRQVLLAVADTGCGINAEDMEMVFDGYLHPERLAVLPSGLSLGLPLCRRIAEGHGGSILAESRPGQGSRFTVSLPDRRADSGDVSDIPLEYGGGFNKTLLALADALPAKAFLLRNED